jgi:hypothetical protein
MSEVRLWRFHLPSGRGEGLERFEWGTFVIGSDGYFSCVTDWGNYAFRWTSPGCDIRKFLQGAVKDPDYFVKKLSSDEYDGEESAKAILEMAKEQGFSGATLRALKNEMSDVENSRDGFAVWWATSALARRLEGVSECFTMRRNRSCVSMVERLMPRLAPLLQQSLEQDP